MRRVADGWEEYHQRTMNWVESSRHRRHVSLRYVTCRCQHSVDSLHCCDDSIWNRRRAGRPQIVSSSSSGIHWAPCPTDWSWTYSINPFSVMFSTIPWNSLDITNDNVRSVDASKRLAKRSDLSDFLYFKQQSWCLFLVVFLSFFSFFLLIPGTCQCFALILNGCCTSAVYFITDHTPLLVCNCEQFK